MAGTYPQAADFASSELPPKRVRPRLPVEGLEPVKVMIPDDRRGLFAGFASEFRRIDYQE
jgi:hypothetical protein